MSGLQLKLCDIQGRLFELSGKQGIPSEPFVRVFMNSDVARGLDSSYNKLQWMGEEYLLEEVKDLMMTEISNQAPKNHAAMLGEKTVSYGEVFSKDLLY